MMLHDGMNDDALSLSMFWAGALMVFTPMIGAGIVLTIWWWKKRRALAGGDVATMQVPRGAGAPRASNKKTVSQAPRSGA
jgi:hypothetical protein